MSFRNEIFQLCKKIQKKDETQLVSNLIKGLSMVKDGEQFHSSRADFNQVAKHSKNQFYGYLYTNDHTEEYISIFPQITPLDPEEVQLISKAHATIMMLIHGCLDDFKSQFPKLYFGLNPYWKYKPINADYEKAESILSVADYQKAILAFKSSALYQKLYTSNVNEIVENLSDNDIHTMFAALDNEMRSCPIDQVPKSIEDFTKSLHTEYKDVPELLIAEIILIIALRKSLENACSLLFTALVGENLIVLNDDNIIGIEKSFSNSLRKIFILSCNDIFLLESTNTAGDIALIDCSPHADYHIHEFGFITSYTANFDQEMGQTSKFTIVIVDELLNPLYLLTNKIITKAFPPIVKRTAPMTPSATLTTQPRKNKISRNDRCPCGSGLKYKFCCGKSKI